MATKEPRDEKLQKSLLTINRFDSKPILHQLTRIADALEAYLFIAHGYHMRPPVADTSGPEPTVDYTDDLTTLKQELLDLKAQPEPAETPIGEEQEEQEIGSL